MISCIVRLLNIYKCIVKIKKCKLYVIEVNIFKIINVDLMFYLCFEKC